MSLRNILKKNKNKGEKPPASIPKKKVDSTRSYTYSYSGADAEVFVWFDGLEQNIAKMDSVSTLSVSVHEAKGQARALGHRGIKGLSRGVRTIGGSLILTVIQDNPLRPLLQQLAQYSGLSTWPGWSVDRDSVGTGTAMGGQLEFENRIAPLIPPFNLYVQYVSEGSLWASKESSATEVDISGAGILLRGVEFIDEGIVTSTHDIVSEVTLSFLACDYKPIAAQTFSGTDQLAVAQYELERQAELLNRLKAQSQLNQITNPGRF